MSHSPKRLWLPHQLIMASWTPLARAPDGLLQMLPGFQTTFSMKIEAETQMGAAIAHHMLTYSGPHLADAAP